MKERKSRHVPQVVFVYLIVTRMGKAAIINRAFRIKAHAIRFAAAQNKKSTYPVKAYFVEEVELYD